MQTMWEGEAQRGVGPEAALCRDRLSCELDVHLLGVSVEELQPEGCAGLEAPVPLWDTMMT